MKKIIFLFMFALSYTFSYGQDDTCETPNEVLEDLNSITKCAVKSSKKTKNKKSRQISVCVSVSKKRFFKKRKELTSKTAGLKASGVEKTGDFNNAKTLALRQSVANLTNTLSAAEVRKAQKFVSVDRLPAFKNCKGVKKDEESDCFNTEMIKHIERHFSYPSEALLNQTEGNVWVRFVIDANGVVTNIKTIGPENGELLELEAKRVASKLPKFIPATKNGKKVAVKYGLPINFSLE